MPTKRVGHRELKFRGILRLKIGIFVHVEARTTLVTESVVTYDKCVRVGLL
jgi:hypothetical protein